METLHKDNFKFGPLTAENVPETIEVMNYYFKHESLSVAVGLSECPKGIYEFRQVLRKIVEDGISFIATESSSGKVVGCLLNKLNIREESDNFFDEFHFDHPIAQLYHELNMEIGNAVRIFDILQTDCYLDSLMMSVVPEFRRQGIAEKLQEMTNTTIQRWINGGNVRVSITDTKPLSLRPIPNAIIGYPTTPTMKTMNERLDFVELQKLVPLEYLKKLKYSAWITPTIKSKLPTISIMCKRYIKSSL